MLFLLMATLANNFIESNENSKFFECNNCSKNESKLYKFENHGEKVKKGNHSGKLFSTLVVYEVPTLDGLKFLTTNLDSGDSENFAEKLKKKYSLCDEDIKIFWSFKQKGMKDFYSEYLIRFYQINKKYLPELKNIKCLKELYVSKKDLEFYRTLRRTIILSPFELDKLNDKKIMTIKEQALLYDMGNDFFNYLDNHAFGFFLKNKKIEMFFSDELLKVIVFNEKMKYEHDPGFSKIKMFLDKHKIEWGDATLLSNLLDEYQKALENYLKR